jgi:hypothetical protein
MNATYRSGPSRLDLPYSIRRASLALKILAVIYVLGIIFAGLPGSVPTSLFETVAFNVFALGLAVIFLVVALALDRAQSWAVGIIRPLLVALVVWAAFTFVSLLLAGKVRIPTTLIVAGIALFLPADGWPQIRLSLRGGCVLVMVAALLGLQTATPALFGWGGQFDVHERDLHARLVVDCGTGDTPPERLAIAYEWSWSSDTLLPNDEDQVVIGWNGDGTNGRPLYVAIELPEQSDGVYLGISSGASGPMAGQVKDTWRGVFLMRLDLHKLEVRPGRIEAVLKRTAAAPAQGQTVTFGATYVHSGVWRSDAPTVTCTW